MPILEGVREKVSEYYGYVRTRISRPDSALHRLRQAVLRAADYARTRFLGPNAALDRLKQTALRASGYVRIHFLRMNISNKMLLGYLPLTVLMIAIAAFAFSSLELMHVINNEILTEDIPAINASQRMMDAVLAEELYANRYAILKTPEMFEMYLERKREFSEAVLSGLEYFKAEIGEIEDIHSQYDGLLREGMGLLASETAKARSLRARIKEVQDRLIERLQGISAKAYSNQSEKTLRMAEIGRTSTRVMIVLCIVGAFLGIGAARLITKDIAGSVSRLSAATEEIANGKFDSATVDQRQDELGDLSKAFADMGMRLKTLEEMYMDSSPLTRLPGGIAIENVLRKRIESGGQFSFCMLDLDNFKALNDHHGYAAGNGAIKATATIIEEAVALHGGAGDFIGHIGGDDFVFITTPERHSNICREIICRFDQEVLNFYNKDERDRGYITAKDRMGNERSFPIMTVSIAVVTTQGHELKSHIKVGEIAADLKEYAKSLSGSNFVVDRRRHQE